jgi:hypothetical protein
MKDYGTNGKDENGLWIMFPSLDRVTDEEKKRRLTPLPPKPKDDIFGMSWDELEAKQGGKLKR